MALVTTKKMFQKAFEGNYAIGAFNINNMEIVQAVTRAAQELNSPVILQVSKGALEYIGPDYLMGMVNAAVAETGIDLAIHLDHGTEIETIKEVIELGFTSVMFDGSHYDFETNIQKTKEVVDYAHARGVVVEAELGVLAGIEDDVKVDIKDATYTDPDQAVEFIKRTGCDSLAIAIGTSHGAVKFTGEPKLRFDILEEITQKLEAAGIHQYPIVLHGASAIDQDTVEKNNQYGGALKGSSGIPVDMLRKATSMSVCKINMDTDIRLAMTAEVRQVLANNSQTIDLRDYLGAGRTAIKDMVKEKITDILGSDHTNN